ncbi:MAG TPA: hypothetical protein VGB83_08915 [Actinomycetota bacterium]
MEPASTAPHDVEGRAPGEPADPAKASSQRTTPPPLGTFPARARARLTGAAGRPNLPALLTTYWRAFAAIGVAVAGIVSIALGWYGAAHTNIITEQIPYLISGGLLGLGLLVVAAVLAGQAGQEHEARALRKEIAAALGGRAHAPSADAAGNGAVATSDVVLVLSSGRSFHEAGCPIVEGKDGVRETARSKALRDGLAVCKLCGPDE